MSEYFARLARRSKAVTHPVALADRSRAGEVGEQTGVPADRYGGLEAHLEKIVGPVPAHTIPSLTEAVCANRQPHPVSTDGLEMDSRSGRSNERVLVRSTGERTSPASAIEAPTARGSVRAIDGNPPLENAVLDDATEAPSAGTSETRIWPTAAFGHAWTGDKGSRRIGAERELPPRHLERVDLGGQASARAQMLPESHSVADTPTTSENPKTDTLAAVLTQGTRAKTAPLVVSATTLASSSRPEFVNTIRERPSVVLTNPEGSKREKQGNAVDVHIDTISIEVHQAQQQATVVSLPQQRHTPVSSHRETPGPSRLSRYYLKGW